MAEVAVSNEDIAELEAMLKTEENFTPGKTPQEMAHLLAQPFDISCRKPKGNFSYIPGAVIRRRVNNATGGTASWTHLSEEFRDGAEIGQSGTVIHIVRGRLAVPGLGHHDGRGTALIRKGSEEQYKSADTDAFKRAAMGFGTGLELYPGDKEQIDVMDAPPPPVKAPRAAKPVSALAAAASSLVAAEAATPVVEQAAAPLAEPVQIDINTQLLKEKDRISASKMREYCINKNWAAKTLAGLNDEQKVEILGWAKTQPDRQPLEVAS